MVRKFTAFQILKIIGYWMVLTIGVVAGGSQLGVMFSNDTQLRGMVSGIWSAALVVLITWLFVRVEKKSLKDYSLAADKQTLPKFLKGLLLGSVGFALLVSMWIVFGKIEILPNPQMPDLLLSLWLLTIVPSAFSEEVLFRSYSFLKLNDLLGLRITQAVTAIAFSMSHLPMGWTVSEALLGPAAWSLIFGMAAIYSKGIAMSTGVHVGVNLIQTIVGRTVGVKSFFTLSQVGGSTSTLLRIITPLIIFATGIILTELYIRRRRVTTAIINSTEVP